MDWPKGFKFGLIIIAEATVMTKHNLFRSDAMKQLYDALATTFSSALSRCPCRAANPFVSQITHPLHVRFDLNKACKALPEILQLGRL